jgi:L-ascorbate 6-phosphate lactonase
MSPGGVRLAVDPYLGNACAALGLERLLPSPASATAAHLDLVCVTHAHLDHLDPEALPLWATQGATLVGPPSVVEEARRMVTGRALATRTLRRGERLECGDVIVTAVPARHTPDSVGYVLDLPGGFKWYVTGDTTATKRLINERTRSCTLLSVCVNGRLGNMRPRSAARLAAALGAKWAMPMHWGMFARNTRDPGEFVASLREQAPAVRALVVEPFRWYRYTGVADSAEIWQRSSAADWPAS